MAGGLINMVSYGLDDLYLTGAPQITLFKIVYRRHTNFSKESVSFNLSTPINFGDEFDVVIPKTGDGVKGLTLQLEIPATKFLKTDTAADLSNGETQILRTPFPINLTSEQLAIVADYSTINNFMAVNSNGYRIAFDNKNIKNQTTESYVSSILAVLEYSDSLDSEYKNALERAFTYEQSVGNRATDFVLFYKNTDIKHMLNSLIVEPNAYESYTVTDVFKMVNYAMSVCVEVKEYYFKKVQEKRNLELKNNSLYAKFAWVKRLGHAIIDKIDVNIGGERIDRHYGDWLEIWYELTSSTSQNELYNKIIGDVREMTTYDSNEKPKYLLSIPLSFWFCKNAGLMFPLVALQNANMSLTVKLKKIEKCAYIEKLPTKDQDGNDIDLMQLPLSDVWENSGNIINASVLVDYIFVDTLERKRFAQSAHEYLIETVDVMSFENTTDSQKSITLDFNGPCKELIWLAQKTSYIEGNTTNRTHLFNYSRSANGVGNGIVKSKLLFNGYTRFDYLHDNFFNYVQPHYHHRRTPSDGINVYSFGLHPEEHQPSGTCNFSRIGNPQLFLTIHPDMFKYYKSDIDMSIEPGSENDELLTTTVEIRIYAVRYNVLRIIGGLAGFAYQYMV